MLEIKVIPALTDNYVYLLRDSSTEKTAVVDPSLAAPVMDCLVKLNWPLHYILNTHHHWDHTGGNLKLKEATRAKIVGFKGDAGRIEGMDIQLKEGDQFELGKSTASVIEIPGHTLGHIAFYFEEAEALFCGDTLFSLGCGRLFEGSPDQMFSSLTKLKTLPESTKVYCGHEYTLDNIAFTKSVLPGLEGLKSFEAKANQLRQQNKPTIPSTIELEKQLNPFLIAQSADEFADFRRKKDSF